MRIDDEGHIPQSTVAVALVEATGAVNHSIAGLPIAEMEFPVGVEIFQKLNFESSHRQ